MSTGACSARTSPTSCAGCAASALLRQPTRSSSSHPPPSPTPGELAERLVEAPVTVIGPEQDGAPQGEKHILFYNPPVVDPELGIRRSTVQESAEIAAHFLRHDVQTIVFGRARLATELMLTHLRDEPAAVRLRHGRPGLPGRLSARRPPRDRAGAARRPRCAASSRPTRSSWASTSAISTPRFWPATPAPSPARGSRWAARAGGKAHRSPCSSAAQGRSTSTSSPIRTGCCSSRPSTPASTPITRSSLPATWPAPQPSCPCGTGSPSEQAATPAELLADMVEAGQLYLSGGRYFWAGEAARPRH